MRITSTKSTSMLSKQNKTKQPAAAAAAAFC
jgi:hypothetical protein